MVDVMRRFPFVATGLLMSAPGLWGCGNINETQKQSLAARITRQAGELEQPVAVLEYQRTFLLAAVEMAKTECAGIKEVETVVTAQEQDVTTAVALAAKVKAGAAGMKESAGAFLASKVKTRKAFEALDTQQEELLKALRATLDRATVMYKAATLGLDASIMQCRGKKREADKATRPPDEEEGHHHGDAKPGKPETFAPGRSVRR